LSTGQLDPGWSGRTTKAAPKPGLIGLCWTNPLESGGN
jgi:hypothetical protein